MSFDPTIPSDAHTDISAFEALNEQDNYGTELANLLEALGVVIKQAENGEVRIEADEMKIPVR